MSIKEFEKKGLKVTIDHDENFWTHETPFEWNIFDFLSTWDREFPSCLREENSWLKNCLKTATSLQDIEKDLSLENYLFKRVYG